MHGVRNHAIDISSEADSDVSSDYTAEQNRPINGDRPQNEDSEDEDLANLDDAAATQRVRERYERNAQRENHAADNAIIEEIICTNFMCHSHLRIKVGPLINFIIGHNGSGKSAVLTALTLCLGGKATATNRGQALKNFIKEGKDAATLSVKIKNQGHTAFKPELYGKSIVVERHFARTGGSGFKLKNEMGKTVSTKRQELEEILDAFALQLDNPMNVLTQDMARQFLNSSSASEKYKFFLKGTHLEDLDRDYKVMAETLETNGQRLKEIEEDCAGLKQIHERAEERLKIANKQQTLHDTIQKFRRQMAWAQVAEQERYLATLDEELGGVQQDIQTRTEKANEVSAQLEESDRKIEELDGSIEKLKEELKPEAEQKEGLMTQFKNNKNELLETQTEQRKINSELKVAGNKIKNISDAIEKEREKLANANDGQHAQKMHDIQDAKDEAKAIQERLDKHKAGIHELDQARRRAEAHKESVEPEKCRKEEEVNRCKTTISELEKGSGQWMRGFQQSLSQLLRLINQDTRFREKPVGPLGRHVQLLQPKWSPILEQSFGASLNGFAVTSKNDQSILSELMRRVGYEGRIFIGNATSIDTSRHEPEVNLTTWLRVLRIDSDLVRNQMIINQGIEQTVLIEDRKEAREFMISRPQNVKQIFAMHDDRSGGGIRFGWSSSGGLSSGPIQDYRRPPRMQTNLEDHVRMERQRLERLSRELREVENRNREAQTQVLQANQACEHHRRETKKLILEVQRAEERVNTLQDELEADTPQTGTLENLETDLKKEEDEKKSLTQQYQLGLTEKERLNAEQRNLKSQVDAVDERISELDAKIMKIDERKQKLTDERYSIVLKKNEAYSKIADSEQRKQALEQARDNQATTVAVFVEGASKVSDRVAIDPGETATSLDAKLHKLGEQLSKAQREVGGSKEELQIRAAEARHKWNAKERDLRESRDVDRMLKKAMEERQRRWRVFRSAISLRASASFTYLLSERQFRGELLFGHKNKTLDIKVSST
jgi:chromosome segregation ATPase